MTDSAPTPDRQASRADESVTLVDETLAEFVASGETLVDACRTLGIALRTTYSRINRIPALAELMDAARDAGYEVIAARTRETIRGKGVDGKPDWKWNKAIVEHDLKLLSKWHSKRYGDKLEVESRTIAATTAISDDPTEAARQYEQLMRPR